MDTALELVSSNTHNTIATMSSTQLADMLGFKTKSSINKAIKTMFKDKIDDSRVESLTDSRGYVVDYLLPELESKMFVAKFDINYLEAITQFWIDGKNKEDVPQLPTTYLAALEKLVEAEKEKLVLTDQRNEAIRTKAMIGDRKTATAMATASNLSRKVKKLEARLQDVGSHMSLLAAHLPEHVETELKPKVQTWRLLKMLSGEMNLPTQEVADPRFGKVKTYHINVINEFKERYL